MSSIRGRTTVRPFFAQIISGNFKIGIAIFLRLCYNSRGSLADVCLTFPGESWKPVCWNRQTRWTQNPLVAIPCGFKSRHRHQKIRTTARWSLFFRISREAAGLEGPVVNDCRWQSEPGTAPARRPGKSRHRHQKIRTTARWSLFFPCTFFMQVV